MGVHHTKCGKFAVQLDSDDVYSGEDTLQKIVNAFYEQNCAMVVGTYQMTDFHMEEIPPGGIIDHREWTPENGRNNALRINGLGGRHGLSIRQYCEKSRCPTPATERITHSGSTFLVVIR